MRPFGCPITIFNAIDHLGKFDGKAGEGFFVGYTTSSKAFRVFNSRTRIVEENLHVQFSANTHSIAGSRPNCLFDIVALTKSINYKPVVAGNQSNGSAGTKACDNAGKTRVETVPGKDYILLPLWTHDPLFSQNLKDSPYAGFKPLGEEEKKDAKDPGNLGGNPTKEGERINQEKDASVNSINTINTASETVNATSIEDNVVDENIVHGCADDPNIPNLEEIGKFSDAEDDGAEADMTNLDTHIPVSPILTTIIHKDHPCSKGPTIKTFKIACLLVFYLKKNPRRNQKDERGIVIKNKARLVAQGYIQEGIDYDDVFSPGKIEEEVYVCQPPGFEDLDFPNRVNKVEKTLYGLHQALSAWYKTLSTYLLDNGFQRGKLEKTLFIKRVKSDILLVQVSMGEVTFFLGLQVKQKEDAIFISRDKYVTEILKIFGFSDVKTASTPMETHKPLLKDADGEDVDEDLYRSMIGSLMYLTSSRPDIMFGVCARDSPFDLVAFTDSDYAGASLDMKSTTGGCQFLGCRLISWQCKKQTVVANSTTKAEYIGASNCYGQVLWIQNQMLDYGYNFMHTKIYIDNESIICIVKNLVFHSKIKHIEIRHHFIKVSNEKKLIQMIKIHTDQNVADLLTKAFDRIIHKGWLEWKAKAAKDGIEVKTGNSRVNAAGHYLVLLSETSPSQVEPITDQLSSQPKKTHIPRKSKRATKISQSSGPISLVADETVTKEREDRMERAATTASSLEAE
ncbi:putative ribonuclease H-like domain-containing protein [Tanacetum coccineum]